MWPGGGESYQCIPHYKECERMLRPHLEFSVKLLECIGRCELSYRSCALGRV
jgi:hypothetical protein